MLTELTPRMENFPTYLHPQVAVGAIEQVGGEHIVVNDRRFTCK